MICPQDQQPCTGDQSEECKSSCYRMAGIERRAQANKKNWCVVELDTIGDWGSDGNYYEYKSIGRVFGPFTQSEAIRVEKGMRNRYSDFEVKEMIN